MKSRKLFLTGMVALLVALSSCNKESDNGTTTSTPVTAYNLYTKSGETPVVAKAEYKFTLQFPASTITMKSEGMLLPQNRNVDINSGAMPIVVGGAEIDGSGREIIKFSETASTGAGAQIKNLTGYLTQAVYKAPVVAGLESYGSGAASPTGHYAVLNYEMEDWKIRTFWDDMIFRGTTMTSYPGMTNNFTTDGISYRIRMNIGADGSHTSDMIFYNAVFAPGMPPLTIVLKDLSLEFTNTGYSIIGNDVVPYMIESGALQEVPRYKFNNITIMSNKYLTGVSIEYKVAGQFRGNFSGNWVVGSDF